MRVVLVFKDIGIERSDIEKYNKYSQKVKDVFNVDHTSIDISTFQENLPMSVKILKMSHIIDKDKAIIICDDDLQYFLNIINKIPKNNEVRKILKMDLKSMFKNIYHAI